MSNASSKKLFYTVGDVAERLDVEPHRVRYWCEQISEIDPDRSPGGQRQFREQDLERFDQIYRFVEEEGFTLEGAAARLRKLEENPSRQQLTEEIIEQCERGRREINEFMESL